MANEVPLPTGEVVDRVEQSNIYAVDEDGVHRPLRIDSKEQLEVSAQLGEVNEVDVEDRTARELGIIDFIRDDISIGHALDITDDSDREIGTVDSVRDTVTVHKEDTNVVSDQTGDIGEAAAAEIQLGDTRQYVDIHYDVDVAGDIVFEVSLDGSTWREFDRIEVDGARVRQEATAYEYFRVWADDTTFASDDVNVIQLVSKDT